MKVLRYHEGTDTLAIKLRAGPATGGGEDVAEGVVFSYNDDDKLMLIEIYDASDRVDLADILKDPKNLIPDDAPRLYTVQSMANELEIAKRTLNQTINVMKEAGVHVGQQEAEGTPILLTDVDRLAIDKWRQDHPVGRPVAKEEPATA